MMDLTKEQLEKAMAAQSPAELLAFAKAEQIPLTEEQSVQYFASLHPSAEKIDDNELENAAGGMGIPAKCQRCGGNAMALDNNQRGYVVCRACGFRARVAPVVF